MKYLKVLITGAGAPGIKGTIYSLRNNFDKRKIEIVCTDKKDEVVGKYLCDKYFRIPEANNVQNYLVSLLNICENEKIDVIIPQNTSELSILSLNKNRFTNIGTLILVSNEKAINIANNKFELMRICKENNIPVGEFRLVNEFGDLVQFAKDLGWPVKPVVIKPPISSGLRGVRIINENLNSKKMFYEEKPTSLFLRMGDLEKILGNTFPELIVTKYLTGDEYTVDVLRTTENITIIPRKRDAIKSGITFNGTTEFNKEIIKYSRLLSEKINLEYCFGFQFKLDEYGIPNILESNPRVQGTMVLATFSGANLIYGAVKFAMGEEIPEFNIKWGTKMFRYWGGILTYDNNVLANL